MDVYLRERYHFYSEADYERLVGVWEERVPVLSAFFRACFQRSLCEEQAFGTTRQSDLFHALFNECSVDVAKNAMDVPQHIFHRLGQLTLERNEQEDCFLL